MYMYIYIYTHMCAGVYVYMYICTHICTHVFCLHEFVYEQQIHAPCMYVCAGVCVCVCIYVYMYANVYQLYTPILSESITGPLQYYSYYVVPYFPVLLSPRPKPFFLREAACRRTWTRLPVFGSVSPECNPAGFFLLCKLSQSFCDGCRVS